MDTNGECQSCSYGCIECEDALSCIECEFGFQMNDLGECIAVEVPECDLRR